MAAQDLGHPPLVCGIRVAVNQADGHRLHAGVLENRNQALYRCLVERDQHRSVRGQALTHGQPEMPRHEGRRPLHEQIRLLEAMLVGHLQAVAHPSVQMSATRAPLRSMMAFVANVVPWMMSPTSEAARLALLRT